MRIPVLLLVSSLAFAASPLDNVTHQSPICYSGPDGWGYYYLSNQDVGDTVSFEWFDASVGTPITGWIPNADDGYVVLSLPFNFPYYGQELPTIRVGVNGLLGITAPTQYNNTALPNRSVTHLIAPFWDDLYVGDGSVYYYDPPDHSFFCVEYFNIPRFDTPTDKQTFEVLFYPDGRIRFNYLDMNGVRNSNTIGIQGGQGDGNCYLQYAYNGNPAGHVVRDSVSVLFFARHFDHDVGVTELVRPAPWVAPGSTQPVQVKVRNFGTGTENFYVRGFIYNTAPPCDTVFEAVPALVHDFESQDTLTVALGDFVVPGEGTWRAKLFTTLEGDEQLENDTIAATLATSLSFGTRLSSWNLPGLGSGFNLAGITFCPDSERFYIAVQDPNRVYSFRAANPSGTLRNESFQLQDFSGGDAVWGIAFDRDRHCFWVGHVASGNNATVCARYGANGAFLGDTWNLAAVEPGGWFAGMDYDELRDCFLLTKVGGTNNFFRLDLANRQVLGSVAGPSVSYRACATLPAKGWILSGGWNQNKLYQLDSLGGIASQAGLDSLADVALYRPDWPDRDSLVFLLATLSNNANTIVKVALGSFWRMLGVEDPASPAVRRTQLMVRCPTIATWSGFECAVNLPGLRTLSAALYDASGRRCEALRSHVLSSGEYRLTMSRDLPAGAYFLMLGTGGENECRRLVIVE
jgi:hypothetical protein